MPQQTQRDNSTFPHKVALRRAALEWLDSPPVVLECYGGEGLIYDSCYVGVSDGAVIEKDPEKAAILAQQRSAWAVYEADTVKALEAGVGGHLPANFIDFDPYGEPHPAIAAFFASPRIFPDTLVFAVNDGLRQKLHLQNGWDTTSLHGMVEKYGNDLYSRYLGICRELIEEKAAARGYKITRFNGYYCGRFNDMTHYAVLLKRGNDHV